MHGSDIQSRSEKRNYLAGFTTKQICGPFCVIAAAPRISMT